LYTGMQTETLGCGIVLLRRGGTGRRRYPCR
jgi:hypothetical protein